MPQSACPRCLEPVEPRAARCPHCGEPIAGHRNLVLWIGVGGVAVLVFVMGLMWLAVRNDDLMKAQPLPDEESIARKEQILADPKESKDDKPDKPEKPPPLNQ